MSLLNHLLLYRLAPRFFLIYVLYCLLLQQATAQDIRTKKNVKKIESIEAMYPTDSGLYVVGSHVPLIVKAQQKKNKETITTGTSNNKIDWTAYAVEVEGGSFKNGLVHVAPKRSDIPNEGVKVKVGVIMRPEFKDELIIPVHEISSIDLNYTPTQDPLSYTLNLSARLYNEETITSKSSSFSWDILNFTANGGVFKDGIITLSETDHRHMRNNTIGVNAQLVADKAINDTIQIPQDFKNKIVAFYGGRSGRNGRDGRSGNSGKDGKGGGGQGSGRDGSPGSRGQDGGDGDDGGNGENVEVYVSLSGSYVNEVPILNVHIKSTTSHKEHYLKINSDNSYLSIIANGGWGGSGGNGGNGGNGGSGGSSGSSNYTNGKSGNGGDGGNGGHGGDGGDGGNVRVYIDPAAKPYINAITILSKGGEGGSNSAGGNGGQGENRGNSGRQGEKGYAGADGTIEYIDQKVSLDW
ncbi:hypothetical protein JMN32_21030 [Fulvivirga sp. 29W222]|uniref:Collagen-like protein n=1 Tax=Fulvivirga marina TaxID=2494733 RepID=A0A937FZ30_9BACT|nr:hypothetical protein [Fulvivirga marina]MBL6448809.1 hypothetical protein [Fulvivirga marina]